MKLKEECPDCGYDRLYGPVSDYWRQSCPECGWEGKDMGPEEKPQVLEEEKTMPAPKTNAKAAEALAFLNFMSLAGWSGKRISQFLTRVQNLLNEEWSTFEKSSREQIQALPPGSSADCNRAEL